MNLARVIYGPYNTAQISPVMLEAAQRLRANGLSDVAAILERGQQAGQVKARQKAVAQDSAVGAWVGEQMKPWWMKSPLFKPIAYGLGAIVILGVLAWAFKPYAALGTEVLRSRRRR
jgi:hypothetical protein